MSLLLLLAACGTPADTGTWVAPGCGDGVVDASEQCDAGSDNSDTTPDACRTDCSLPTCGDGVVDADEGCEDGNTWGADGCSPSCQIEALPGESEPNDLDSPETWDSARIGALSDANDRDCFAVDSLQDSYLSAQALGPDGLCPELVLELYSPEGARLAVASPGEGQSQEACTHLDPTHEPGARFLQEGVWTVCVAPWREQIVSSYQLEIQQGEDSCALKLDWPTADDIDQDGLIGACDPDEDGDGILDTDDNCPEIPNSGDPAPLFVDSSGFITDWLVLGPLELGASTDTCLPTGDALSPSDSQSRPELGQAELDRIWTYRGVGSTLDFTRHLGEIPAPPREAYAFVWIKSDSSHQKTLSVGADDGVVAWFNGNQVLSVSTCQGTNADQFQATVQFYGGWNSLLFKVYDQGGGWGLNARFLDEGSPSTDLELSFAPTTWAPDQSDQDGDGIGDVCDDTPQG
ncbi:MAG: DUF4215 domain-containing protein [Myxococcota bacterium]|nr:DUF4215 domain-containing protein [Myxococcota bacterium]